MYRPRRPLLSLLLLDALHWFEETSLTALTEEGWPGLTRSQARLLLHIEPDGTPAAELARRVHVTRQTAHRQVVDLARAGLAWWGPEKRVVRTAGGEDCGLVLQAILQSLEADLPDRVGGESMGGFAQGLERGWGPAPPPPTRPRSGARRRSRSWP